MNRLKFLLFAVVALGLWSAWLAMLSGGWSARAVEAASLSAQSAPRAVALELEKLRTGLLTATLKAAAGPAARQKPGKPEAPTAERVSAARAAALEALGEGVKAKLVVGAVNELGALVAVGEAAPAAPPAGFDPRAIAEKGSAGQAAALENVPHLFYSAPIVSADKVDLVPAGHLFVGLPVALEPAALDQLQRDLGLSAIGLAAGGELVAVGGVDKKALESLLKSGKLGEVMPLNPGSVSELGPVKLPMMTAGDTLGGRAPLAVGFRRDLAGTPFEVVTVASTRGLMSALAELQRFALLSLLGLLVVAIGVAVWLSERVEEEAPAIVAPQLPRPPSVPPTAASALATEPPSSPELAAAPPAPEPEPLAIPDGPLGQEASPDDFHFGGDSSPNLSPAPPVPDFDSPGVAQPMGSVTDANPIPPPDLPPAAPDPFAELNALGPADQAPDYSMDASQRTVAYPVMSPYAAAGAANPSAQAPDFNPDTTRVATVPKELLKASQRISQEVTAVNPRMAGSMPRVSPTITGAAPVGDEAHWQDVFQQFVAMREKCGEPADGLTYEKFSAKLRKNKEQLVQKYNCRTVRFQVHAKDGKAALKATPVRD